MGKQKILFIVAPHVTYEDFVRPGPEIRHKQKGDGKFYRNLFTDMPLGILSLSGYVKKHVDVDVRLIDFNVELNIADSFAYDSFADYFYAHIAALDFHPDVVGISSLFTPSYHSMLELGASCRKLFPEAVILAGGSVPANMYQRIFAEPAGLNFDALCYGEGERPLLDLLKAEDKHDCLRRHPSWITRDKAAAGAQFAHDFIHDLDEIPFFDYDLCSMEKYGVNPTTSAYPAIAKGKNHIAFHVQTSRGCPFRCTFCASHKVHGRTMRYYSVERVKQDFLRLRDQYGAALFVFQDDHFMGDTERAHEIIDFVRTMDVAVFFQNGLAVYALDRRMLEALHGAGFRQLVLTVESGSERVLKEIMKKPLKLPITQRVVADCRDLGIYTNTHILIGMPGETKQDIAEARAFLKTVDANWFHIFCASPLVGSEMYEICEKNNYLKEGALATDYKKAIIETEDFTAEYIQETAYEMNLELNFVENADVRLGKYEVALMGFDNAIRAKHDHVFAYYYGALCLERLGRAEQARQYLDKAALHAKDSYWRKYVERFGLPL